jgi:hypothetical protein
MSRYIDIEPILEWCDNPEVFEPYGVNSVELEREIRQAPSIDIVFCKECKYEPICSHSVQHITHEPTSVTIGYKSVDFCSYGEVRDE